MGFYTPDSLIKAARHDGVVLPVCVIHSKWEADLETGAIWLGFTQVVGLGEETGRLIESRGPWWRLEDFLKDLTLAREKVSLLASANAN
ncbi:MAG: hypothetical protein A2527_03810 [Candidatus Lambdaproteobacteria bacterium RIFOXYD2_FULL_50_16]|uniref:DNA polymerase helix-hairpin-helix motif domain-containing protein n=1 Tax=Candidatus Lambdaproteobacteria bacterium RIFOXYD2_FULL_50_16 TaxID=1817772 RepID=A0A1F6GF07_9PROT|nr:MAG: hypothetical protein A2527_03810 [Candidatus Lambdaproteobacteria bacterium RIFOXYD2_FULL_50_16]